MPIAAVLARAVHQPLDLALGEIASLDCQVYGGWSAVLGCRFHAGKLCLRAFYCIDYTPFLHSLRPGCADFPLPVLHGRASLAEVQMTKGRKRHRVGK